MQNPPPTAAAPDPGPPPGSSRKTHLKRAALFVLAALVLAPGGALLAAPLKHAFADFIVATANPKSVLDGLDGGGENAIPQPTLRREGATAYAGGKAATALAVARPPGADLSRLADAQPVKAAPGDDRSSGSKNDAGAPRRPLTPVRWMEGGPFAWSGHESMSSDAGGLGSGGLDSGGLDSGGLGGQPAAAAASTDPADAATGSDPLGVDPAALGEGPQAISGAPEPAAWMSLILGFGLAGGVLRRRRGLRSA